MKYKALIDFFSDATSPEARAFVVVNSDDEALVEGTIRDIDDRIAVLADAPHALRVLAHQARLLWQSKLA